MKRRFLNVCFLVAGVTAFAMLAHWLWNGRREMKRPQSTGSLASWHLSDEAEQAILLGVALAAGAFVCWRFSPRRIGESDMKDRLGKRQREGNARLLAGFALSIPLCYVAAELAKWSGIEREFQLNLISGCFAAVIIVFVTPVFWRGAPWQAPVAFILLVGLPGFVVWSVVTTILKYSDWY